MAVYTNITSEQLLTFLAPYRLGALKKFTGIAEGVSNSNYLLDAASGRYILTLFEQRTNAEDLPYFLTLTEFFDFRGIPCPKPIKREDGAVLGEIAGRPAVIVSFLPGASVLQPDAELCAAAGKILATMHQAGIEFPLRRANGLGANSWEKLLTEGADGSAALRQAIATCAGVQELWPAHLPRGAVHADFFPENVFFDNRKLSGVIDFYFSCNELLAYDLAIAINAWCVAPSGDIDSTRAGALVRAYHATRRLHADEIAAMPLLLKAAALRFLATRQYDWTHRCPGALVTPKDPAEYLRILAYHTTHPDAFKAWL